MEYQIIGNLSPDYLETLKQRFWDKVDTSNGPDSCWEWTASLTRAGYGQIGIMGAFPVGAHRLVYELEAGPIPEGMNICHHCDNPKCCNPNHLFLGDYRDNLIDMLKKGRNASHVNPRLVRKIRKMSSRGVPSTEIADEVKLHPKHVEKIVRRECWGFVQ